MAANPKQGNTPENHQENAPIDVKSLPSAVPKSREVTEEEREDVIRIVLWDWFPHLTHQERSAIMFIYALTYLRWRRTCPFTYEQCVVGYRDEEGDLIAPHWASSKARASYILNDLVVNRGMLKRAEQTDSDTRLFGFNLQWYGL